MNLLAIKLLNIKYQLTIKITNYWASIIVKMFCKFFLKLVLSLIIKYQLIANYWVLIIAKMLSG